MHKYTSYWYAIRHCSKFFQPWTIATAWDVRLLASDSPSTHPLTPSGTQLLLCSATHIKEHPVCISTVHRTTVALVVRLDVSLPTVASCLRPAPSDISQSCCSPTTMPVAGSRRSQPVRSSTRPLSQPRMARRSSLTRSVPKYA